MKQIPFKDRVQIHVLAGKGGDGVASFRREKFIPRGGPSGGDGGRGGHVFLRASRNVSSLVHLYYEPIQRAEAGGPGRSKQQYGRNGRDRWIEVPCGTEVRRAEDGDWVGEVLAHGDTLRVARGGKGGLGNCHFATPSHRAPRECTPGEPAEEYKLILEMKLVADAGLVGYPNAGKSSLLRVLSAARPKVAPYPFTTLHPAPGTVIFDDLTTLRVTDIPGLIDGAHRGVGLGHDFLRHIERTSLLVLVLDMAGVDGRDPAADHAHLLEELQLYRADLMERPRLVVANKMDLPDAQEHLTDFIRTAGIQPLPVSALTGAGIPELKAALRALCPAPPDSGGTVKA